MSPTIVLLLLSLSLSSITTAAAAACGSCLLYHPSFGTTNPKNGAFFLGNLHRSTSTTLPTNNNIISHVISAASFWLITSSSSRILLENQKILLAEGEEASEKQPSSTESKEEENPISSSMVFAIGLYKKYISPLLPPACRFVPTCSQYGVQAIQDFGPSKGAVLTAWRILRCTPFGGRGYDPPRWPPVAYNAGSY